MVEKWGKRQPGHRGVGCARTSKAGGRRGHTLVHWERALIGVDVAGHDNVHAGVEHQGPDQGFFLRTGGGGGVRTHPPLGEGSGGPTLVSLGSNNFFGANNGRGPTGPDPLALDRLDPPPSPQGAKLK